MSTTRPLTVACAGAGYFSRFHLDAWARIPGIRVAGVWDRDPAASAATGLPAFATLTELLDATRPDIFDVILPPQAQAPAIRAALAHGVATIVCQKPFGLSHDEAAALAREAGAAGARLVIHENFRFQPWYRAARRVLDARRLGDLHAVTFRLRPGDGQGADAYLGRQPAFRGMTRFLIRETAVHFIDTFRYLLGDPLSVYADLRRLNPAIAGEDAGIVLFEHPGGVRALFDGDRHLDHASDNLRRTMGEALFEGTDGVMRLTGDGALRLRPFGSTAEEVILGPDTWAGFGGDCVHALQSHVVGALRTGGPLENEAQDYLTVIRAEEAIYVSAETGRKVTLTSA